MLFLGNQNVNFTLSMGLAGAQNRQGIECLQKGQLNNYISCIGFYCHF